MDDEVRNEDSDTSGSDQDNNNDFDNEEKEVEEREVYRRIRERTQESTDEVDRVEGQGLESLCTIYDGRRVFGLVQYDADDEMLISLSVLLKGYGKRDKAGTGKDNLPFEFNVNFPRIRVEINRSPSIQWFRYGGTAEGLIRMIDTFDRPAAASVDSMFARKGKYSQGMVNEQGKRVPKKGAFAEAAVAETTAAYKIFDVKAKLLYAEADVGVSVTGFYAMAIAGLATMSFNAGPFGVKVGLSLDTGASFGMDGVGFHILGIGFKIGPTISASLFGNEIAFNLF